MKTLRMLTLSLLLTAAFSINAVAQQPPACIPGDTQSPPCSGAQSLVSDSETGTVTGTVVEITSTDLTTEVTMDLIETLLSIF